MPDTVQVMTRQTFTQLINSTTEDAIIQYSIGTVGGSNPNYTHRMEARGRVKNNSGSNKTVTFKAKINGTVVWQDDRIIATDADERPFSVDIWVDPNFSDGAYLTGVVRIADAVAPAAGRGSFAADLSDDIFQSLPQSIDWDAVGGTLVEVTVTLSSGAGSNFNLNRVNFKVVRE